MHTHDFTSLYNYIDHHIVYVCDVGPSQAKTPRWDTQMSDTAPKPK